MSKHTPTTSPAITARDTFVDLTPAIDAINADPELSTGARTVLAEIDAAQVAHALGLQMLRASFGLTQADVAANLGLSQANIAQTEHRQDLLVSTLRRYVKAITGGELRLIITFPNRAPLEFDLGEVASPTDKRSVQQPTSRAAMRPKAAPSSTRPEGRVSQRVASERTVGHVLPPKHTSKASATKRTSRAR